MSHLHELESNPYASPATIGSVEPEVDRINGMPYASQNKRLLTFFIDNIAIRIFAAAGGFAVGMMYVMSNGGQINPSDELTLRLAGFVVGIVILLAYFIFLEGLFGVTLGKLICGTRVVNATGGRPSFGQVVGRSFARMIPFEPFSFLFGDKTTGWHDSLSGTRVVDTRSIKRR